MFCANGQKLVGMKTCIIKIMNFYKYTPWQAEADSRKYHTRQYTLWLNSMAGGIFS